MPVGGVAAARCGATMSCSRRRPRAGWAAEQRRPEHAARGVAGGGAGAPAAVAVRRAGGPVEVVPYDTTLLALRRGDVVSLNRRGRGGYGPADAQNTRGPEENEMTGRKTPWATSNARAPTPGRGPRAPSGCRTCRRTTHRSRAEGDAGTDLLWAETVAPGGYTHLRVARGTRIRPRRPDRRRVRARPRLQRRRAGRAPQRRRHAEDPVAGLPRPRSSASVGGWTRPRDDRGGHLGASRRLLRHHERRGETSSATATRPPKVLAFGARAAAARGGQARADDARSAARRDVLPGRAGGAGRRPRVARIRGPGTHVDLVAELPLIVLVANVPHACDPATTMSSGPPGARLALRRPTAEGRSRLRRVARARARLPQHIAYAALAGL